jgi:transcriptional regulator with XRE-family HTH domain
MGWADHPMWEAAMTAKDVFVANLKRLIDHSPMSRRQVADRAGVSYSTLNRWLENGVLAPDGRTKKPLQKICRVLHVGLDDLWAEHGIAGEAFYPEKVRELYDRWERLKADTGQLSRLLDAWYNAGRVAERFRREEPDLAQVVAKVKTLPDDGHIQTYLESLLREWNLAEDDAYRRLIETTQRFLAAALPEDPEQLGQWFLDTHPRRWAWLIESERLDHEGELFAYVRHIMAEGLSKHEAYESLLRLSHEASLAKSV